MAETCNGYCGEDGIIYLKQYRDSRKILADENVVGYMGRHPIIKIENDFYTVRTYVPEDRACEPGVWKMEVR